MKLTLIAFFGLTFCGAFFAAPPISGYSSVLPAGSQDFDATEAADGPYIIFSNLDSARSDRFDTTPFINLTIAGDRSSETETWYAVQFRPKVDVQAKTLAAAVGYISGTKLVTLGLYNNNEFTGTVGDPIPGGQASTTRIPDLDQCCQLTKVTLSGDGVILSASELYWLVVGPDNEQAPDFLGAWHFSNLAHFADFTPEFGWQYPSGQWPAAEIRGTQLGEEAPTNATVSNSTSSTDASNKVIFSNLDRLSVVPFLYGSGLPVYGNQVTSEPEIWEALPFTPKADYHAKTLAAAIAWITGTKLVNLGIYSDDGGKVGTPLPGGQGSTINIPTLGDCCELTEVRLPRTGVQLLAGTQYWLVASPDNVQAPTFKGAWQTSILAIGAYQQPEDFVNWSGFSGNWLAAEIRGTSP
jgi:hypothetical protein